MAAPAVLLGRISLNAPGVHTKERMQAMMLRKAYTSYGAGAFMGDSFVGSNPNILLQDALVRFGAFCFYNALSQPVYEQQYPAAGAPALSETARVEQGLLRDVTIHCSLAGAESTANIEQLFRRVLSYRHGTAAHMEKYGFGDADSRGRVHLSYHVANGQVTHDHPFNEVARDVCRALNILNFTNIYVLWIRSPPDQAYELRPDNPEGRAAGFLFAAQALQTIQQKAQDADTSVAQCPRAPALPLRPGVAASRRPRIVLAAFLLESAIEALRRRSVLPMEDGNTFNAPDNYQLAMETVAVTTAHQAYLIANKIRNRARRRNLPPAALNSRESTILAKAFRNYYTHFNPVTFQLHNQCAFTARAVHPGDTHAVFQLTDNPPQPDPNRLRATDFALLDAQLQLARQHITDTFQP